jgi:hypothetical protein
MVFENNYGATCQVFVRHTVGMRTFTAHSVKIESGSRSEFGEELPTGSLSSLSCVVSGADARNVGQRQNRPEDATKGH